MASFWTWILWNLSLVILPYTALASRGVVERKSLYFSPVVYLKCVKIESVPRKKVALD